MVFERRESYPVVKPVRAAFLGLGVMGRPMAAHLAAAGHAVTVYNRTTEKARRWSEEFSGGWAATPREAVREADVVFACVGNDDDLRSVVLGDDGALAGMKAGAVFVDHTTDSAQVAREMHERFRAAGCEFLDAPVSGGESGAQKGCLTVMVGGGAAAFERVRDVVAAYACAVTRLGEAGSGQLAKMCNQIAIAGLVQGLSEAVRFGENAGLDMKTVLSVIEKGAAGSWQMSARGGTMLENRFDFGFAVKWMRKDLAIALEEARRNGSALPVTALVDNFYGMVQARGGDRWDTSSLITLLPKKDG